MNCKLLKKLIVSVIAIVFIFQPVFNILCNIGHVEAAYKEGDIVRDNRRLEQINWKLGNDLKAVTIGVEYQLTATYIGHKYGFEIWADDSDAIYEGLSIPTGDKHMKTMQIQSITKVGSTKKWHTRNGFTWKEKLNTYDMFFVGQYTSDWQSGDKLADLPNVKGSYNGSTIKFDFMLAPSSMVSTKKRYVYKIVKNIPYGSSNSSTSNSSSSSSSNNSNNNSNSNNSSSSNNNSSNNSSSNSSSNNNSNNSNTNNNNNSSSIAELTEISAYAMDSFTNIASVSSKVASGEYNPLGHIESEASKNTLLETASIGTAASMKKENPYENMSVPRTDLTESARRLYIRNLYRRVLKREPSNDEINAHFNKETHQIARDIILSSESEKKNNISSLTYKAFIKNCYKYILGRDADENGLETYYNYLEKGNSKKSLINILSTSKEFYSKTNKTTKTLTLDANVCNAVAETLRNKGYSVIKPTSTSILMYEDELNSITSLNLSGKGLTNLSGISNFKNLKQLNISNNKITNLNDLTGLTNLEELTANNNAQLTNIDGLKKLTKLKKLEMNSSNVARKALVIGNLTELRELHLENNSIESISTFNNLTKLEKLYLSKNRLTDVSTLDSLSSLRVLYLDNNTIKNVGNVGKLNLTTVSIKNNAISLTSNRGEFDVLDVVTSSRDSSNKLYTSKDFELENCKIENNKMIINTGLNKASITIKGGALDGYQITLNNDGEILELKDRVLADKLGRYFSGYREIEANGKIYMYVDKNEALKLQDLYLAGNDEEKITDLTGLSKLSQLKVLCLDNNLITNYDELAKIKTFQSLSIRNNGLTNLNGLKNVKNLKQLNASNNQITDVSGISGLSNLKSVVLSNNNIRNNLAPLNNLTNLDTLILDNNSIQDVSSLSSLKLSKLSLSKNSISDVSAINKENLSEIKLNNNTIELSTNSNSVDIPNVIKSDILKNKGLSNLECVGCSLEGGKIVLDEGVRVAEVNVKSGELSDTVVNVQDERAIQAPVLQVSKRLINNNTQMMVEIIADKQIEGVLGWDRIESSHGLRKIFDYNVHNQCITVRDLYGNEKDVIIDFDGVVNTRIPDLTISYNEKMRTNKDVTITISSSENLAFVNGYNTINPDGKSASIVFSNNTDHTFTNIAVISERMYNMQMQAINVTVEVANIDKIAPVCDEVEYSSKDLTKGNVNATIWSNEEIVPVDTINYTKCKKVDDNERVIYGLTFFINENMSDVIKVKDLAGNITDVNIAVSNIDKMLEGVSLNSDTVNVTNQGYSIRIKADEAVKLVQNQAKASAKFLFKTAANSTSDAPLFRIAENDENDENDDEEHDEDLDEYINLDITEPSTGVADVTDEAGNEDYVLIDTDILDKDAPNVAETRTQNGEESVTITLKCNEPVIVPEESTGWVLGEDNQTLTKTYYSNQDEIVSISDLAGNIVEYEVNVGNIQEFECLVAYRRIEDSDQMIVVITGNRELKQIDGWELSEDKRSIGKTMGIDETLYVTVYDINDNKEDVTVKASFADEDVEEIEEDDNGKQKNNQPVNDKSQAIETMPQSGEFVTFALVASFILIAVTVVTLIRYKRTLDK